MVNYTHHLVKPESDLEMQSNKTAEDIILKSALTLKEDMSIVEACDLLANHGLSGAPVTTSTGKLIGFLSEKDCLKYLLDMKYYNNEGGIVGDFMSRTLMTIHKNETLLYITELFMKNHFQMYPVVDEDGIFLGVVTRKRLFNELNRLNQTSW
ncbi:CBS domain-containing protein [Bacteriovorax sp. DB6_IX]|uniref:CBS domain-containing protein n=1 Tax=Bacteriovorax sp. DB6_IX TaxID=1353530 RepID=UPI00038A2F83|nr:CBS domain-containing protein [Bacteriovorax sp. DB6_IX]EQC52219.1 CBS domain protein [Bacteriovorax sp. DB6_IX]